VQQNQIRLQCHCLLNRFQTVGDFADDAYLTYALVTCGGA
jgi:hypothetical protein